MKDIKRDQIYLVSGEELLLLKRVQARLSDIHTLAVGEKFDLGKSLLYVLDHVETAVEALAGSGE
jgi:hypothetical protein